MQQKTLPTCEDARAIFEATAVDDTQAHIGSNNASLHVDTNPRRTNTQRSVHLIA